MSSLPLNVHLEHQEFRGLEAFQAFASQRQVLWTQEVKVALRLIALNGIRQPITQELLSPSDLRVSGLNFRETLDYRGCISRHRGVLLMVQLLIEAGVMPGPDQLRVYCPEQITPFAALLQELFPRLSLSEFLPDPSDRRHGSLQHEDLCELTYADQSFDLVLCNDLFEHLYDLSAGLRQIARVLRPGGWLVSTFPILYNQAASQIRARHRSGASPGVVEQAELLMEPEFHGNPLDPSAGSLVYQTPGWDVMDQFKAAGLQDPCMHWLAAPSYGVLGAEIPAVLVFTAQAP